MLLKSITDDIAERIARKDEWDILVDLSKKDKQLDIFVTFWAQVLNGGIEQWIGNRFVSMSDYRIVIKNVLEVAKYSKKYGNTFNAILKEIESVLDSIVKYLPLNVSKAHLVVKDFEDIFGLNVEDTGYEDEVSTGYEDEDEEPRYEMYYDPRGLAAVEEFNDAEKQLNKLDSKLFSIPKDFVADILSGIKSKSKITFNEIVKKQTGIDMKKLLKDFEVIRQSGHTNMLDMQTVLNLAKSFHLAELSKLRKMNRKDAFKLYGEILENYGK